MNSILVTYATSTGAPLALPAFPQPLALCLKSHMVVHNAIPCTPPLSDHYLSIPGDNSAYEFSGWQKAVNSDFFQSSQESLWCLANDAFPMAGSANMPTVTATAMDILSSGGGLAGRLRRLPVTTTLNGLTIDRFIQTHLFFINKTTISKLGSLVSEASIDPFLKPNFHEDPFTKHPIWNPAFKDFMLKLLTQRWHGKGKAFIPDNYPFFRRKVLSILNELSLTARVMELGMPIINLTPLPWLLDSPTLLHIFPGRPVALSQAARNLIFRIMDLCFMNPAAKTLKLDKALINFIERDWLKRQA